MVTPLTGSWSGGGGAFYHRINSLTNFFALNGLLNAFPAHKETAKKRPTKHEAISANSKIPRPLLWHDLTLPADCLTIEKLTC